MLCFHHYVRVLAAQHAHINIQVMKYCKGKAAESAHKAVYKEIYFASTIHLQSCKLQAKTYRWNDEILQQEFSNHARVLLGWRIEQQRFTIHVQQSAWYSFPFCLGCDCHLLTWCRDLNQHNPLAQEFSMRADQTPAMRSVACIFLLTETIPEKNSCSAAWPCHVFSQRCSPSLVAKNILTSSANMWPLNFE